MLPALRRAGLAKLKPVHRGPRAPCRHRSAPPSPVAVPQFERHWLSNAYKCLMNFLVTQSDAALRAKAQDHATARTFPMPAEVAEPSMALVRTYDSWMHVNDTRLCAWRAKAAIQELTRAVDYRTQLFRTCFKGLEGKEALTQRLKKEAQKFMFPLDGDLADDIWASIDQWDGHFRPPHWRKLACKAKRAVRVLAGAE